MSRRVFKDWFDLTADEDTLWEAQGLLARWFRMQPSEMEGMEPWEFVRWVKLAGDQIRQAAPEQ